MPTTGSLQHDEMEPNDSRAEQRQHACEQRIGVRVGGALFPADALGRSLRSALLRPFCTVISVGDCGHSAHTGTAWAAAGVEAAGDRATHARQRTRREKKVFMASERVGGVEEGMKGASQRSASDFAFV